MKNSCATPAARSFSEPADSGQAVLSCYSLRVFSPAGVVELNGSSKTGVDATI
jgi:hypothetical protein